MVEELREKQYELMDNGATELAADVAQVIEKWEQREGFATMVEIRNRFLFNNPDLGHGQDWDRIQRARRAMAIATSRAAFASSLDMQGVFGLAGVNVLHLGNGAVISVIPHFDGAEEQFRPDKPTHLAIIIQDPGADKVLASTMREGHILHRTRAVEVNLDFTSPNFGTTFELHTEERDFPRRRIAKFRLSTDFRPAPNELTGVLLDRVENSWQFKKAASPQATPEA